jgi:DNA-binding response OmpR family regulator
MEPSPGGLIVAVSDDPAVADDLRFGLPDGFEVVAADDARTAWKEMTGDARHPVAVVVDLQTGSAGGFSLAREMATSARLETVPVVMLIERDQDTWLARQAGAEVVLRRPLHPGALAAAVLSALSRSSLSAG